MNPHERYMGEALRLARRGLGATSPNPAVGCVIVSDGRVVGCGWHRRAGSEHAEAAALRAAGPLARGSDVYVTLEPCRHHGRTPPCAAALIEAGVRRVFVGTLDPNPRVNGAGAAELRRAGVEVVTGVREAECLRLNEAYNKHITTGLPFVTLKLACSLDGRTATSAGESRWITGTAARRLVHRMRARSDAVMVGAGTVLKDDPELTVRHVKGRAPLRVIVDEGLSLGLESRLVRSASPSAPVTVFTVAGAGGGKAAALAGRGVEVVEAGAGAGGLVDLNAVLAELGRRDVTSVLVEGGSTLAASLVRSGLADRLVLFFAPMLIGGEGLAAFGPLAVTALGEAPRLRELTARRVGGDVLVEGLFEGAAVPGGPVGG